MQCVNGAAVNKGRCAYFGAKQGLRQAFSWRVEACLHSVHVLLLWVWCWLVLLRQSATRPFLWDFQLCPRRQNHRLGLCWYYPNNSANYRNPHLFCIYRNCIGWRRCCLERISVCFGHGFRQILASIPPTFYFPDGCRVSGFLFLHSMDL